MVKKRKEAVEVTATEEPATIESSTCEDKLRENLEEIKNYDGVVGYILRNTTSASIDLKEPAKIIDYATLSSTAFDATEELSRLFEFGDVKDIIVDGKNLKMLSLAVEENKISVFMENNADVEKVLKKLEIV
jgi:predicted regulator of Ras-like GTPase activity (Roadblock/LC7/MglB family)